MFDNTNNGLVAVVSNPVISAEYHFDVVDRISSNRWVNGVGNTVDSFAFGYDNAGMITNIGYANGESVQYDYDSLYRLTGERKLNATNGVLSEKTWQYDLAGNRTVMVENGVTNHYALGVGNRLSTWGTNSESWIQYAAAGNATNIHFDASRNLRLTWNDRYQITSISTNGALAESFTYDGLGRRASISDGVTTNFMVYDGVHLIAETDGGGTLLKSYTYGPGIDNLLAMTVHGTTPATYYFVKDHLGSIHAAVDSTGAVVERYEYDGWGCVLGVYDSNNQQLNNSAIGNRFLWQGREYSWKAGLYNFRARWYDPSTGRWLSNDPIGISGGLNQYVFCGNNPVNFVDPWGLDPAETGFMGASQTMGGYLDGLLFGVLPDQDNANYRAGQTVGDVVSLAGGLARLGYAGAAKGSSLLLQKAPTLANAMKAVARRNTLKKVFRLNPWSKYRIYPFDKIYANPKYHGDLLEIIKASGRTNPYLNLLGAGMAGSALYDLLDEDESTPSSDECK